MIHYRTTCNSLTGHALLHYSLMRFGLMGLLLYFALSCAAFAAQPYRIDTGNNEGNSTRGLVLGLGVATVGDKVQYSPNLPEGGFRPAESRQRYAGNLVSAQWSLDDALSLSAVLESRRFTSLRDSFEFRFYQLDASFALPALEGGTTTSVDLSIATNRAARLHKNSYTSFGDNLIKEVTVSSPRDMQWRASLRQVKQLTDKTSYGFFSGLGQTWTQHREISGMGVDTSGCQYDFNFNTGGGVVSQRDVCGSVRSMLRVYPNEDSIERDLSVAPTMDMQNNAWFYRVGGNFSTRYKKWRAQLAFYHQRYWRSVLDQRIRSYGGEVYDRNNVVTLQATRFLSPRLSYTAALQYNEHQFLDELPVLYTRLTSERFAGDSVHFVVRMNYQFNQ
jgi:hypothetical protein